MVYFPKITSRKKNMTNEELWQAALSEIELSISKANFITWFKSTTILSIKDGHVVINVPNGFAKEWLENKYNLYILRSLRNLNEDIKSISCIISTIQSVSPLRETSFDAIIPPVKTSPGPEKSLMGENNLNPRYVFENFVIGGSNELARAACFAVSQSLGTLYNPLFIYGGVGLGKTHLIQSIGNEILKNNSAARVRYIPSEKFTNDFIEAAKMGKINDFTQHYKTMDLLIIDDIQFISGKERTQEQFFHIFNHLYQSNKQIVLSSDKPPKAIQILEERLRSRFEGGMIADISRPDLETRTAILRKKAFEQGVEIEKEALEFIAQNIKNNIRELEGAFNRVLVSAQLTNQIITLDYATKTLSELISSGKKKGVNHKHILKIVSDFYDINPVDIIAKNRKQEVVKPRQMAMYLMRTELQYSYPRIGEKLGGRDHTTAIHAYEKISKALQVDDKLNEELVILKDLLYQVL